MKHPHNPEGFKNRSDVFDQCTVDEIRQEIIQECFDHQIRFHFDIDMLDRESKAFLTKWRAEMRSCLKEWNKEINTLISQDERISLKIREYLETKGMNLPTFDLYAKDEADITLHKYGFSRERVEVGNFLVVFNLPKQLDQYWWKGGVDSWGREAKDVRRMVIEWGRIYRLIMPVIWKTMDRNVSTMSTMERINPCNVHSPKQYYYLWEIGTKPTARYNDIDA